MSKIFKIIGLSLLFSGFFILILTFFPVIREELKYAGLKNTAEKTVVMPDKKISPLNADFGIIIPKIGANTKVIPDVDPNNSNEYQWALTKGVAHAKGSAKPGEAGNVFIFAHSAGNFYEANRFNAVFYLLTKLEKKDDIYLYFQKQKYHYQVINKSIVDAAAVNFMTGDKSINTLTLMTCWPPGTSWKRLIIIAELR